MGGVAQQQVDIIIGFIAWLIGGHKQTNGVSTLTTTQAVVQAAARLSEAVSQLNFAEPVTHVYNPLEYAWEAHVQYLEKCACAPKKVIFLGMNPGPWGMAQVGVPFGEVSAIRDWVGVSAAVGKPAQEHPKRPIEGFDCQRSEVSGRRLWGLFADRFASADIFFEDHFVANYCPLVFMEESGRNRTPDKLPASEQQALQAVCDAHLRELVDALSPEWMIGVGAFAQSRIEAACAGMPIKIGKILHPSPASPAANKDFAGKASSQMQALGLWD